MTTVHDPGLYLRMCEPRSLAVAAQAAEDFGKELRSLREKYGIADVSYCIRVMTVEEESPSLVFVGACGSQEIALQLSRYALDKQTADYAAHVSRVIGPSLEGEAPKKRKAKVAK